jgi:hypothetical protein
MISASAHRSMAFDRRLIRGRCHDQMVIEEVFEGWDNERIGQ